MPKQVDHEARRRLIAEAVLRVTGQHGLEAVSLRDVAAEAGVSMGMVQHYFKSKDEMLLFACKYLIERSSREVQARAAAAPTPMTSRDMLRNWFIAILPLDAEHRMTTHVWIAFLARAVLEPDLQRFMRETWIQTHYLFAEQLRAAQRSGELPAGLDPEQEARTSVAVVDGLVSHVLIGHYSPEQALATIDDHLDRLFGG